MDLRFGKLLTVGSTRIRPRLDIFNLFNASSPQTYRSTVLTNVNYGRIGSVLSPRFVKLGASVDF
ncbi:MAG: hypothetical protein FJW23_13880 [Acidimicrobiia bacterium]|nr:hypothetical protein [Acidimicrobiia bacterium]